MPLIKLYRRASYRMPYFYYPVTVQPFAVAMDGSSPVVPGFPVTVIVLLGTVVGKFVYIASNAVASRLQFATLNVFANPVNAADLNLEQLPNIFVVVIVEKFLN